MLKSITFSTIFDIGLGLWVVFCLILMVNWEQAPEYPPTPRLCCRCGGTGYLEVPQPDYVPYDACYHCNMTGRCTCQTPNNKGEHHEKMDD